MLVAITGSHGLIGSALTQHLRERGDEVRPLVRSAAGPEARSWDPSSGTLDASVLDGVDAVVHLAGVGIADHRWNADHKRAVRDSRIKGTHLLATTMAAMDRPPVLISGSAIGYYGDRGAQPLTEDSAPGTGFLAELCVEWERAADPAREAGVRVVHLRTGIVLTPDGGALAKQLPLFRLGLGGRLGSGEQYLSWITLDDEVRAIAWLLRHPDVSGAVNMTAPSPVTNREFTSALGAALHRPAVLAVPPPALRLAMGAEMANEMILGGARVLPRALESSGFEFAHRELGGALEQLLQ